MHDWKHEIFSNPEYIQKVKLGVKKNLYNREVYVEMHQVNSKLIPIKCGVPQGSLLGPLLFILHLSLD